MAEYIDTHPWIVLVVMLEAAVVMVAAIVALVTRGGADRKIGKVALTVLLIHLGIATFGVVLFVVAVVSTGNRVARTPRPLTHPGRW